MLGDNKCVDLNGYGENCVLPFVDSREFVNICIKLAKCEVEVRSLFTKQKDKNSGAVVESVGPQIIKQLFKVFVGPRRFSEPEHAIFNLHAVLVLQGVEVKTKHVAESV